MRKKQFKHYIQLGILLLSISLLLTNCQKDDDLSIVQQEILKNESKFKVFTIGKSTIDNNTQLTRRLDEFSESIKEKDVTQNKTIYSNDYDFYIDTDFATYIENTDSNYHSYTFPIERSEETDLLENLVLSFQEDGTYKAMIVTYDITNQEKLDLINRASLDLANKVSSYLIDDGTLIGDIFDKELAQGDCVGILMCPYGDDHPATQVCINEDRGDLYLDDSMCTEDEINNDNSDGGGSSGTGTIPSGGDTGNPTGTSNGGADNTNVNPDATIPVLSIKDKIELCLGQINESGGSNGFTSGMLDGIDKIKLGQINGFLENSNCDEETQEFALNVIQVLMANPDANPLLGADCRSFEYAQPPGALQKGCAVSNFNHTFYTAGVRPNGSPYYGDIDINYSTVYFTMPPSVVTNGQAANLTAIAVTAAIKETDKYFFNNPDISEYALAEFFKNAIINNLSVVGGTFSTTVEPFPIPSPAPYITSVLGLSNPFDC